MQWEFFKKNLLQLLKYITITNKIRKMEEASNIAIPLIVGHLRQERQLEQS